MDHSTAETLLDDWLWGRLPPAQSADVEAHVRGCKECSANVDAMRGSKPDAAGPAPWRALKAWYSIADQPRAWLKPALAIFAILLAWPAYLGMVEYPREKLAAQQARAEAARAAAHATPTPGAEVPPGRTLWNGGGAAVLVLTGATRGTSAAPPSVKLHPGQPGLTIVTDRHITAPDTLLVTLFDDQHRPVWKQPVPASELWDANAHLTSVMIPSPNLTPGDYSLEIGAAAAGGAARATGAPPQFAAKFRVSP
jgi:hypothetical protein